MANWSDYAEAEYLPAMRTAFVWQAVLGVPAALLLDGGQIFRIWVVALLCHWAIIWLFLFRRPLHPTRLDLAIVRYAMPHLMILIGSLGPLFLRAIGVGGWLR